MKYTTILFDMGNVVIDFSPDYILSNYTKDVHLINVLKHAIFLNPIWSKSDGGGVQEDGIFLEAKKCLEPKWHDLARDIIATWYHHITANQKMYHVMRKLKQQGYKLILCSNAAESFHRYCDNVDAFVFLDAMVVSSDISLVKPHKEFFEYVLKKYDLNAKECFFVDDLISNIKGAYECGIDGYWYNGNVDLFEKFLIHVGILAEEHC